MSSKTFRTADPDCYVWSCQLWSDINLTKRIEDFRLSPMQSMCRQLSIFHSDILVPRAFLLSDLGTHKQGTSRSLLIPNTPACYIHEIRHHGSHLDGPKQRNGGHSGVHPGLPKPILIPKHFLLFQ